MDSHARQLLTEAVTNLIKGDTQTSTAAFSQYAEYKTKQIVNEYFFFPGQEDGTGAFEPGEGEQDILDKIVAKLRTAELTKDNYKHLIRKHGTRLGISNNEDWEGIYGYVAKRLNFR